MNKLYEVTDTLLLWQAIGSLVGLCVSVVLVQLVRTSWSIRSLRQPGTLLSAALIIWDLGGLVNSLLITAGFDYLSVPAKAACAFGYTGLTILTWAVLAVWKLSIEGRWKRQVHRLLQILAIGSGALITSWLWIDAVRSNAPLSRTAIRVAAEAILYLLVFTGVALALTSRPVRTTRLCAGLTIFGGVGPLIAAALIPVYAALPLPWRVGFSVYAEQSINYVAVAAFILLARMRYTDALVERALRILTMILLGACLWYGLKASLLKLPPEAHRQTAFAIAAIASATILALLAPVLNRGIQKFTARIFQHPDFDGELKRFSNLSALITDEVELVGQAEKLLTRLFALLIVQAVPVESLPNALRQSLTSCEILETQAGSCSFRIGSLDADALLPITWKDSLLTYVIAISRSGDQRGFLASEVSFLYRLMGQLSLRLEMIRAEREKGERERREALLVHQSTEAELRALRAQINPHFLFNALNTIADLIVVNAYEAERLTEKLAEVFRHVLANSQKSTIPLREEIEFVRRYLEIEEARFRNRLQVRIDMDSEAAGVKVPSLILQPLVENAVKHGLAPKIDGGVLSVSASLCGHTLLLTVEDDGVGFRGESRLDGQTDVGSNGNGRIKSNGIGLANIGQRLRTLYGAQAEMRIEQPATSGCRVTIRIPL